MTKQVSPEKARIYARAAHSAVGQKRKGTDAPYYTHTENVAELVNIFDGSPEMIAAAYLHDVVEDTFITVDDIRNEFGDIVAGLVDDLTDKFVDPAIGNRKIRKNLEHERLENVCDDAKIIKLCDVIDNTNSLFDMDESFRKVYIAEIRDLLNRLYYTPSIAWDKANNILLEKEALV